MRSSAEIFLCSKNFLSIVFPPFMLMLHSFISFIHLLAIWKKRMDMDHIMQHIYRKTGGKKIWKFSAWCISALFSFFHISYIFRKINRKEVKNFLLYSFNWIFLFSHLLISIFYSFIYDTCICWNCFSKEKLCLRCIFVIFTTFLLYSIWGKWICSFTFKLALNYEVNYIWILEDILRIYKWAWIWYRSMLFKQGSRFI